MTGRFFLPFRPGSSRVDLRHNQTMNPASSLLKAAGATGAAVLLTFLSAASLPAQAQSSVYYECPGNVFTNTITPREAEAKGCKAREAQQPTTIPAPRPRPSNGPAGPAASRVDAQEQRDRDSDARKILQAELAKAQAQLAALQAEYNNGQPERLGDEKNFQKYIDRTADLKASIARTQNDINAIQRELSKAP